MLLCYSKFNKEIYLKYPLSVNYCFYPQKIVLIVKNAPDDLHELLIKSKLEFRPIHDF